MKRNLKKLHIFLVPFGVLWCRAEYFYFINAFNYKKDMKKILVFLFAFTLLGCAVKPANITPPASDQSHALIYVIRPDYFFDFIRIKGFSVYLDEKIKHKEIGTNKGNNFIYFYVEPGNHVIYSESENIAEIRFNAKANEIIYIKQTPRIGVTTLKNELSAINKNEAQTLIKQAALGKMHRNVVISTQTSSPKTRKAN